MAAKTRITLRIEVLETVANDLGTAQQLHVVDKTIEWPSGTNSSQADTVWSDSASLAGSASELDVRGGLTATLTGSAVSFAELACIYVENTSTTTAKVLEIGDATSNPLAGLFEAVTNRLKIGPGGFALLVNPIDGYPAAAGSADVLRIDPGSDTITHKTVLIGRSA